jgi:homogentisate 1,2-dioxygenase
MTEFMGLIHGGYDAKKAFLPGGASLHSCMTPHGPDATSYDKAVADPCEQPTYFSGGLAFMFETSCMLRLTKYALEHDCLETTYGACWKDLPNRFQSNEEK